MQSTPGISMARQYADAYAAAVVHFLVTGFAQQVRFNGVEWEHADVDALAPDSDGLYVGQGSGLPSAWPDVADPKDTRFDPERLRRRLADTLERGGWSASASSARARFK